MRKRSNNKQINQLEQHHRTVEPEVKTKRKMSKSTRRVMTVSMMLISIFALTLLFNFYFNYTSGIGINPEGTTTQTKYLLSGPDPYYNLRTIRWAIEAGHYPWAEPDKLLEYPINIVRNAGSGARPPLMNIMAIAIHLPLTLVMPEMDALGFAIQFLPALFGALLIFPVYFLGKELFNWKVGLLAAFFIPLIPVHLASGHGSAFTLFDHDALVLLLFSLIYLFYIRSIKAKSNLVGITYSLLSGLMIASMVMLWVEARYTYAVLLIFFVVQVLINLFIKKYDMRFVRNTIISWSFGYALAFPMLFIGWGYTFRMDTMFVIIGISIILGIYYFAVNRLNVPWIVSIPLLFGLGVGGAAFIHFFPATELFSGFGDLNRMIFGSGLYGSQTALTIAEAQGYDMSRWIMSFGPTLFLIAAICGFPYAFYKWMKTKRYDYLFICIWFVVTSWLNTVAGRFINDYVPLVAIFSAVVVYLLIEKIDYKGMVKKIRNAGGGFHGIRKSVRIYHILGVLFLAFVIMIPNVYMALDAAIPTNELEKFGKTDSTFGLSTYKDLYWTVAYSWLAKQDSSISDYTKRPGYISWWDYGFQEVAVGDHPTVADNYQRGIECAANFQTAASEKEAIADLIVLLLRADSFKGAFSNATVDTINKFLPPVNETVLNNETKLNETIVKNPATDLQNIILNPEKFAPSFNKKVGNFALTATNAQYHDSISLLNASLSEEQMVQLYEILQNITGFSVRYYGTEGYDMEIFNVFSFLAGKGTYGYSNMNDEYYELTYTDKFGNTYSYEQVSNLTETDQMERGPFEPSTIIKDKFYETMVVRAYRGVKDSFIPGYQLKHFIAKYISPYPYPGTSNPSVIISKYYPGGTINGTATVADSGMVFPGLTVAFVDDNLIPHDVVYSDTGSYSLVSLPGNFTMRYYLGTNMLKELSFNGTDAISEAEAERTTPHHRTINVSIDYGNVTGHVDGGGNMSIGFTNTYFDLGGEQRVAVDSSGNYSIKYLLPSEYSIVTYSNDYAMETETFFVMPGAQVHNVSLTKGLVYGHVDSSLLNKTLKFKMDNGLYLISVNNQTLSYAINPIPIGSYPLGIYADNNSTTPLYNLTMNVTIGAREFDIHANP
jgi:dolichyl-phosphooligosaccharide-protein glycotransferase